MESASDNLFDADIQFPVVPQERIPQDAPTLQTILAGERGLRTLYSHLDSRLTGEGHCLAVLLRRDWERHFGELMRVAESILASMGAADGAKETLPPPEQIEQIARSLEGSSPKRVLEVASAFAARTLICYQMVPWMSEVQEVHEHFRACVEAEDRHLALQQLLAELLKPLETV